MFKESTALFLYAETSVHAGSGESLGAIDLAIQRERYTGFPCVAAQGIKGPVRDWFERKCKVPENPDPDKLTPEQKQVWAAFGPNTKNASEHAGAVAFTDARILLFPVRSMKGVFAWITCPFVLGRLARDLALAKAVAPPDWQDFDVPKDDEKSYALGASAAANHACTTHPPASQATVLLEEEVFTYQVDPKKEGEDENTVQKLARWLNNHAFPATEEYAFWRDRIASHLLVLHDDDFRHFVRTATEVQARVALGEGKSTDTKKGGNLFYQENLPPDTLLYSVVLAAADLSGKLPDDQNEADKMLEFVKTINGKRLQIGGDETTGKGYVYTQFLRNGAATTGSGSKSETKKQEIPT